MRHCDKDVVYLAERPDIPGGYEEVPLKEGGKYLKFSLAGALITKAGIEHEGGKAIIVPYFEVHKLQPKAE